MNSTDVQLSVACYHCGDSCGRQAIVAHDKSFCCQGCLCVYEILNKRGMCDYYQLHAHPGSSRKTTSRPEKFAFLDQADIKEKLTCYKDDNETHVIFSLPQIHCSSCLWLLENLHRLNENIQSSRANFARKEVYIVFRHQIVTLRTIAELLGSIGYEPYISLQHLAGKRNFFSRSKIFKLGVAGFCFANIMLFSFPEYLGIDMSDKSLLLLFRWLNFILSLPVLLYSASEFYTSAWKSIRHRVLNIDAPIVLAILVTFGRSVYEVITATGSGYFDSMSGIVFFMLAGRVLQDKTYDQLDFERDYTSYFPVAVTRIVNQKEEIVTLPEIKLDDTLLLHSQELVPADGILTKGRAVIDYSFVTGESIPVVKEMGEIIYAGGKQLEANIELLVIKEVNQGYLTRLWNRQDDKNTNINEKSFVNLLSRYFTLLLFGIAAVAAVYWYLHDPARIWNVITSILIVACPCALLLSNTFTNGNIIRILGRNGLYLKNAQAIEQISSATHIVFDKTGTLTHSRAPLIAYDGKPLTRGLRYRAASLAKQSTHPISRAIGEWMGDEGNMQVLAFKETPGMGIEGIVGNDLISIGSSMFITGQPSDDAPGTCVYLAVESKLWGVFRIRNRYRDNIPEVLKELQQQFSIAVLSGDNAGEMPFLRKLLGENTPILFNQGPEDKLHYIAKLQAEGKKIIMIGDGLNDAGALKQADAGIALAEGNSNFTPASDAILAAEKLAGLPRFIRLCRANRKIVLTAFAISVVYNIAGLFFAVQGLLSPMIAAILMPASSLSILAVTFGLSNTSASRLKLKQPEKN